MDFNILVAEDDQHQFDAYSQALEDHDFPDNYRLLHAKTLEEAQGVVSDNIIHAAIVDLKMPKATEDGTIENGTEFLKVLLTDKKFPVAVVSANISSLHDDDPNLPQHLFKKGKEPGVHSEVFEEFDKIKGLMHISPIVADTIKEITPDFTNAFWELWGHWDKFNARFSNDNQAQLKRFLKRYVCSYLIEKWLADDLFSKMHHTEFYTHPPVKDRIHTGDILEISENDYWIVITAPCDLSNGESKYPENLTLLRCVKEDLTGDRYKNMVKPFKQPEGEQAAKDAKIRKAVELFTKLDDNSHYLPPWKGGGVPVKVMFKEIQTISFDSLEKRNSITNQRVASLSAHFLPYLLQRYGSYVSRIGQSDINGEDYINYLLTVVPDSTP